MLAWKNTVVQVETSSYKPKIPYSLLKALKPCHAALNLYYIDPKPQIENIIQI